MAARSPSDILVMRGSFAGRAEGAGGGAECRSARKSRELAVIDCGRGSEGADATSEHAWNDMFLYPVCQEKNAVPVIFSSPEWSATIGSGIGSGLAVVQIE